MDQICIRPATPEDCSAILKLIQELANYEKMPNGPKLDIETFIEDGFGKEAFYKCFVAELTGEIVGYTLYYFTYSTWEGKSIYMEDLYITPNHRHQGAGMKLWKAVVKEGLKVGCSRTDFAVLDWNIPSIDFYKKNGATNLTSKEGWQLFRLNKEAMITLCAN